MPGVTSFRSVLNRYIIRENIYVDRLVGKYIPNLTAKPFEVSRDYFEDVKRLTNSPVIEKVLAEVCFPYIELALTVLLIL